MKLTGLGYKSELIFMNFDGDVEDRGSYLVVRTPSNPNYFWGNLLIFDRAPAEGDAAHWINLFKEEFPDPRIYHVTLGWDSASSEVGSVTEFTSQGYELQANAVLAAKSVKIPPRYNEQLIVRPLKTSDEWNQMVELQIDSALDNLPKQEWEKFYRAQSSRYQAMTQANLGNWYGGYLENKLVAGLGIYHSAGIGRFQIVCTHPEYRRRGVCGTLVYRASLHAFEKMGVHELVMCADPGYHAINIYESVGFIRQQIEYGVSWWDRNHGSLS